MDSVVVAVVVSSAVAAVGPELVLAGTSCCGISCIWSSGGACSITCIGS